MSAADRFKIGDHVCVSALGRQFGIGLGRGGRGQGRLDRPARVGTIVGFTRSSPMIYDNSECVRVLWAGLKTVVNIHSSYVEKLPD
jgi:hypothetical protein